jgi:hypothetical protein
MNTGADPLADGRRHYAQRAWDDAYRALDQADRGSPLAPADLQLLAQAAGLSGRDQDMVRVTERVHQEHLDAGAVAPAVRAAVWVALRPPSPSGEPARGRPVRPPLPAGGAALARP